MAEGRLYDVARRHRSALLSNERQAASEMVRVYGAIWQRLRAELLFLLEEMAQAQSEGVAIDEAWLYRQTRYETLIRQAEAELRWFAQYASERVRQEQAAAVEAATANAEEQVRTILNKAGISTSWVQLPADVLEDLVGFTGNGSPLRELLETFGSTAAQNIRDSLLEGVAQGWNPERTAAKVRQFFGGDLVRALRISRTETLRAYREATLRSYQANEDVVDGWIWNAACTERTCAMCVTGDTVVSGPLPQKVFTRHYTGDIVIVETASGKHLSITPNHPILTRRGWIKAGLLKEGDYVIGSADSDGAALAVRVDNYQMPTLIREVAESFGVISAEMECASPDFHGDGVGSEVYIVRANSLLWDEAFPLIEQPFSKQGFALRGASIETLGGSILPQLGGMTALLPRLLMRLGMIVEDWFPFPQRNLVAAFSNPFFSSFARRVSHPQASRNGTAIDTKRFSERFFRFASLVSGGDFDIRKLQQAVSQNAVFTPSDGITLLTGAHQTSLFQDGSQALPTDTELGCNLLGSLTGKISADRVLKVAVRCFSGHVYNLQTESGWYFSNGIITHNCWAMHGTLHPLTERLNDHPNGRCSMLPHVKNLPGMTEQWQPEPGPDQFDRLDPGAQKAILGPLYDLYQSGEIELSDVVAQKFDSDWGSMRYVKSLASLLKGRA